MIYTYRLTIFLAVLIFLIACDHTEDIGPKDDDLSNAVPSNYELVEIKYFLADGDGIDTASVLLPGHRISNHGPTNLEQDIVIDDSGLVKKSKFVIDHINELPDGLVLDSVNVHVPSAWHQNESYSLYPVFFPLGAEQTIIPYKRSGSEILTVKVPAKSRIEIDAEIDACHLRCSFQAVFVEQTSGARHTVQGKWNGTLRYINLSIKLIEFPLE